MSEFEELLNQPGCDDPDNFLFKWERQYWGDKVTQWTDEEPYSSEDSRTEYLTKPFARKHKERIRKTAVYKEYIVSLYEATKNGYPSAVYKKENEDGSERLVRFWRKQSSKGIKKRCNRLFRRKNDFEHTGKRGVLKRVTEFWLEYC